MEHYTALAVLLGTAVALSCDSDKLSFDLLSKCSLISTRRAAAAQMQNIYICAGHGSLTMSADAEMQAKAKQSVVDTE